MKKLLPFLLILMCSSAGAQSFIANYLEARNQFKLNGYTVFGISNDSSDVNKRYTHLMTEKAVKLYVAQYVADHGGSSGGSSFDSTFVYAAIATKQNQLNGTGFVKVTGTTVSYDNNTYLTTALAASTYQPIGSYLTSYTETDPIWLTDKPSYLTSAGAASTYSLLSHTHAFSALTSKPTTLSGYGITDAYPLTGNPSGFLTSYSETDPVVKAINGLVKSNGSTIAAAVAGTDYLTPTGSAAGLTSFPTFNQNTTGSAASWTTGRTLSITGDLSYTSPSINGTGNVTAAGTLATVNGSPGSFGGAAKSLTATVNGKGLLTSLSEQNILIAESQVTNLVTDLSMALDDNNIRMLNGLGSSIKAQTFPFFNINAGTGLGNQTVAGGVVTIGKTQTLTGVYWYQSLAGVFTSSNYNGFGLYSISGSTATLVASTTDDGNIFKSASNDYYNKDFTTPYVAAPGDYAIVELWSQSASSTTPQLGRAAAFPNTNVSKGPGTTNSAKAFFTLSGTQTSLPSSFNFSSTSTTTAPLWLSIY